VAYSGDKDSQKQAADVMAEAMDKIGVPLAQVIGKDMGHNYTPEAAAEINRRIDRIVAKGRDPLPKKIEFTTWTLRYPRMHWITIEGMGKHWEPASVRAHIGLTSRMKGGSATNLGDLAENTITINTINVNALTFHMDPGWSPFFGLQPPFVIFLGSRGERQDIISRAVASDRSWTTHFRKNGDKWENVASLDDGKLRKKPGLQGPIDDAFMDRFLMVRPTGKAADAKVEKWAADEMTHAVDHWRRQFRGIAPVKDDAKVTEDDIANSNLILWGDPKSNSILAKIADKLPIKWDGSKVIAGDKTTTGQM
jgi:hypothetical protein